ncbi:unnamed protein product [Camellia sinensis]
MLTIYKYENLLMLSLTKRKRLQQQQIAEELVLSLQWQIFEADFSPVIFVRGLCAFSPSLDGCFLALTASTTKGSVLVYNVMERHSHCE